MATVTITGTVHGLDLHHQHPAVIGKQAYLASAPAGGQGKSPMARSYGADTSASRDTRMKKTLEFIRNRLERQSFPWNSGPSK